MKQLYKHYAGFDDDDNLIWYVHELNTDQIVGEYFFEEDAIELCKFLEKGNGFAGFTPTFILRRVPKNINDAFTAEFA